jgi:hypothetical protein
MSAEAANAARIFRHDIILEMLPHCTAAFLPRIAKHINEGPNFKPAGADRPFNMHEQAGRDFTFPTTTGNSPFRLIRDYLHNWRLKKTRNLRVILTQPILKQYPTRVAFQ